MPTEEILLQHVPLFGHFSLPRGKAVYQAITHPSSYVVAIATRECRNVKEGGCKPFKCNLAVVLADEPKNK